MKAQTKDYDQLEADILMTIYDRLSEIEGDDSKSLEIGIIAVLSHMFLKMYVSIFAYHGFDRENVRRSMIDMLMNSFPDFWTQSQKKIEIFHNLESSLGEEGMRELIESLRKIK